MIKNNRPYTNENGHIDDGLITDKSGDEIDAVSGWIKENIRPARDSAGPHQLWLEAPPGAGYRNLPYQQCVQGRHVPCGVSTGKCR